MLITHLVLGSRGTLRIWLEPAVFRNYVGIPFPRTERRRLNWRNCTHVASCQASTGGSNIWKGRDDAAWLSVIIRFLWHPRLIAVTRRRLLVIIFAWLASDAGEGRCYSTGSVISDAPRRICRTFLHSLSVYRQSYMGLTKKIWDQTHLALSFSFLANLLTY